MKQMPYPRTRPSGVEWLGDIPDHWNVARMRFHVRMNPSKQEVSGMAPDTEVSFLPMEAVGDDGSLSLDQFRRIGDVLNGYTYFAEGDVAFAKITPCFENGKGALMSGLREGFGFGTTELTVLRVRDSARPRFVWWLTKSHPFRKLGEASMYGAGGQKRVPDDFAADFNPAWPPLVEQDAIAAFLDRETAKIDALVAEQRTLIEKLREKRTSLIFNAVTQGLVPLSQRKTNETDLQWAPVIPQSWTVTPLGYLVSFRGGGTPSKDNPAYWNGDIPWVSPKDMKVPRISDAEDHVSPDALLNSPLSLIPTGHLLVVVRGMILAHSFPVALTEAPVTINQDMKAIGCGGQILPGFLYWYFRGLEPIIVALADQSAHGTKKIESSALSKLPITLPPMTEQQEIAAYLDRVTTKLDALSTEAETSIALLQEHRSALITALVTGKVDVRGHAKEPSA